VGDREGAEASEAFREVAVGVVFEGELSFLRFVARLGGRKEQGSRERRRAKRKGATLIVFLRSSFYRVLDCRSRKR